MNALIDVNRLNYLIKKGQDSYSDGREEFEYELLRDLMKRLGVKIYSSYGFAQKRNKRYERRYRRSLMNQWHIVVTSTDWLTYEHDCGDEPMDKGVHVHRVEYSAKEVLNQWRHLERRRKNPHEKWEIKLVRRINPKLP